MPRADTGDPRELWNDVTVPVSTVQQFMDEIAPLDPDSGEYQSGRILVPRSNQRRLGPRILFDADDAERQT